MEPEINPPPRAIPAEVLDWDSQFFGFKVGRAFDHRLSHESAASLLAWGRLNGVRCLYLSADPICSQTLHLAHVSQFKFVDMRLDFEIRRSEMRPTPEQASFKKVTDRDLPALARIARESHLETRFFMDSNIPSIRAADLYEAWIRRDHAQHHVFSVSDSTGSRHMNYITCQLDRDALEGRIGLLAVANEARGRGLGQALVQAALDWFWKQGCHCVRVATQGANVAAQRLYQKEGFRTASSLLQYHRWF
jgi:dTDP-4-amino-4,6-dideoxy-D-galactose acyltransferase